MYGTPGFVVAKDTYQYLSCPGTVFTQISVANQPVAVGFGRVVGSNGPEAAVYDVYDQTLLPGSNPIPQMCDAIRFKNATPGIIGIVQINARSQKELPQDATLQTAFTPSYLLLNPDGSTTAQFNGSIIAQGMIIPTTVSGQFGVNSVSWVDNLTLENQKSVIYGLYNPATGADSLNIQAVNGAYEAIISLIANNNVSPQGTIQIQAGGPAGAFSAILFDYLKNSMFLEKKGLSADNIQYLLGSASVPVTNVGVQAAPFALGATWPNSHVATFATVEANGGTTFGPAGLSSVFGSNPISLTQAQLIVNNVANQTLTVHFISFGT